MKERADDNNDETFGEGAVGPDDGGLGGINLGIRGLRVSSRGIQDDADYVRCSDVMGPVLQPIHIAWIRCSRWSF